MDIIKDKNVVEIHLIGKYIKLEDVTRESASMIKNSWEYLGKFNTEVVLSPANTEEDGKTYSVIGLAINGIDIIDPSSVDIKDINTTGDDNSVVVADDSLSSKSNKRPISDVYTKRNDEIGPTVMYNSDKEYKTPLYRLYHVDSEGKTRYYCVTNTPYVADRETITNIKNAYNFLKSYSIERVN